MNVFLGCSERTQSVTVNAPSSRSSEGKVLMLHRTDNDSWCFPGGSVELGEKVEETAKREALEETGLLVKELEIFDIFSGRDQYYKYPNGGEVYNVDIVFWSKQYAGQLIMSNSESKGCCFFDLRELPIKISPPVLPVVDRLKQRFGF